MLAQGSNLRTPMHRHLPSFVRLPAAVLAAACLLCAPGYAGTPYPSPLPVKGDKAPAALALPAPSSVFSRRRTGTGFFVDDDGHLVTAYHVVVGCGRVMVIKEDHHVEAKVVALSAKRDLALLAASKTLGLAAVFPQTVRTDASDMVFAAAYDSLPGLKLGGGVLANATVTGRGGDGELALDSSVTFGASGAPVLDSLGLVQGVISRRTATGRVLAVSAGDTKAFLLANGVDISADDRPQIAPYASRAHRAASISVRVVCQQR